jgi:hypothetical protein
MLAGPVHERERLLVEDAYQVVLVRHLTQYICGRVRRDVVEYSLSTLERNDAGVPMRSMLWSAAMVEGSKIGAISYCEGETSLCRVFIGMPSFHAMRST